MAANELPRNSNDTAPVVPSSDPQAFLEDRSIPPFSQHWLHSFKVPLGSKPRWRQLFLGKKSYWSCGLSPNCKSAYFLNHRSIYIYPINDDPGVENSAVEPTFKDVNHGPLFREAAISDRFLALITNEDLQVIRYNGDPTHPRVSVKPDWKHRVPPNDTSSMGDPNCINIHETTDHALILVGLRRGIEGRIEGRIELYRCSTSANDLNVTKLAEFKHPDMASDFAKTISFDPNGERFACTTNTGTRVLIWSLCGITQSSSPFNPDSNTALVSHHLPFNPQSLSIFHSLIYGTKYSPSENTRHWPILRLPLPVSLLPPLPSRHHCTHTRPFL
jgi:hypothetical protein